MRASGGFVLADEATVAVDPAVGALDNPAVRVDDEPGSGLRTGYDVDGDASLCGGGRDGVAGVALVEPPVRNAEAGAGGVAERGGERRTVLNVRGGDVDGEQQPGPQPGAGRAQEWRAFEFPDRSLGYPRRAGGSWSHDDG